MACFGLWMAAAMVRSAGAAEPEAGNYEPTSHYREITHRGWPLMVNRSLIEGKPELWKRVLEVLDQQLFQMERVLPKESLAKVRTVRIWVEDVEKNHPCMVYHPDPRWLREHDVNPEKARCVEIANAENFIQWTILQPWMVLHEMAHAYHHQFLDKGFDNPEVLATFRAAMDRKAYHDILRINGRREKAYATTNQMEYFAECSEALFGTNDFYPYVRSELREHDAEMERLLLEVWGVTPRREKDK